MWLRHTVRYAKAPPQNRYFVHKSYHSNIRVNLIKRVTYLSPHPCARSRSAHFPPRPRSAPPPRALNLSYLSTEYDTHLPRGKDLPSKRNQTKHILVWLLYFLSVRAVGPADCGTPALSPIKHKSHLYKCIILLICACGVSVLRFPLLHYRASRGKAPPQNHHLAHILNFSIYPQSYTHI